MEPLSEEASKLLDDLSEDELDSAFSRVVNPAPQAGAPVAESVAAASERLHSLVARSEVHRLAEDELARVRASNAPVEWFLADGGRPSGPFELDELRERWACGQIGPDTVCWGEGLTGWTPICRVPALTSVLAPVPPPQVDLAAAAAIPQEETVVAPSAAGALKDLIIEEPPPAVPAPVAPVAAPPPPLAPAPVVRQGVSHGRVALYVGLSATLGAIAGGALVGLFAVQLLRFLPGANAPSQPAPAETPKPVATAAPTPPAPTPAPAPALAQEAPVAPPPPAIAPPPHVESTPPPVALAAEPPKEQRPPETHHARSPAAPAPTSAPTPKKEKPAPPADDEDVEVIAAGNPPPAESASTPEIADAFDQAFGSAPSEEKPRPSKSGKTVYVPPAAGKVAKAQLSQGDIMQVVVANKDQVVKCLNTARETEAGLSGKLLMRWTVMPSGETSDVEALPGELTGSELARCVAHSIQGWKFPQHSAEQAPITFPFVF